MVQIVVFFKLFKIAVLGYAVYFIYYIIEQRFIFSFVFSTNPIFDLKYTNNKMVQCDNFE